MEHHFFSSVDFKARAQDYIDNIGKLDSSFTEPFEDFFKSTITECTTRMLDYMMKVPQEWDMKCQYNIELWSSELLNLLKEEIKNLKDIQKIFAALYPFVVENIMFDDEPPSGLKREFYMMGLNNNEQFDNSVRGSITGALLNLPGILVKKSLRELNISAFAEGKQQIDETEKKLRSLKAKMAEEIDVVVALSDTLKDYKNDFNFAGLHSGFTDLGKLKAKELRRTKWLLILLGAVLPLPVLGEAITLSKTTDISTIPPHLISLIPVLSLTLIFIYFFRIVLVNFNSVRAQLMQIELRKSLCQFIQAYADYSKEIRTDKVNPLAKFEDVIFSNIMSSDEKTPSTFDGIEQLASMIKAVKGK
ncbi:hypothetical protein ACN5LW_002910 [Cronobacter turicensis]|uniref:hypothetical protein n=1 Tax=Cronobacter turicensis TaxID=413502 RepID=UPI0013758F0B|nr:hypothetical protein [Cronobacter turicensis]ELY4576234.1 hypothetical protein [Cronobacter turicensis]NCH22890.1 hypothetical protein [Cronobacter turicensis]